MRSILSKPVVSTGAAIFGAWTVYGLFCSWQAHYWYAFTPKPMSWGACFKSELTYAWLWALATPLALFFARRFRFERPHWFLHALPHIGLLLVLLPATKLIYDLVVEPPNSAFYKFNWTKLLRSVEMTADTGTLLYLVVIGTEHAFVYYRRYQTGLRRSATLQTQLVQSQLQALKMQLHPHFLFNTLNTITALVHENPEMAERTIARLSELLRLFLANSAIHEVPLGEELRILDLYLEIERARFEDRLRIAYDVPADVREAMVPNLLLQPLVENSIRHGLGRRAEPGTVTIAAERQDGDLVIKVTDDGVGLKAADEDGVQKADGEGMGLGITRGRLQSLYGPAQSLVLRSRPSGGAEARIVIPFHTESPSGRSMTAERSEHVEV